MSGGRPSDYNEQTVSIICLRLAEGESLNEICRSDDMPAKGTVFRWLAQHPEFQDRYARAREVQADAIFEEILEIADDGQNDWMERNGKDDADAGWVLNGEHLQRSRLRIDARKWVAGKLRPKVYGDKVVVGGDKEMDPIQTEEVGSGARKLEAFIDSIAERSGTAGEPDA